MSLEDYATAAMQVPGTARATARLVGGPFNTVMVLVDPQGSEDDPEALRGRVAAHLERLRMTGREHVVRPAEYVPLEAHQYVRAYSDWEVEKAAQLRTGGYAVTVLDGDPGAKLDATDIRAGFDDGSWVGLVPAATVPVLRSLL